MRSSGTALLMGWQFTLAEFIGGPIMIVTLAVLFRVFLRRRMVADALEQANKGVAGSMEGARRGGSSPPAASRC